MESVQQDADADALTTLYAHTNDCITSGSGSLARARRRLQLPCHSKHVPPAAFREPSLAAAQVFDDIWPHPTDAHARLTELTGFHTFTRYADGQSIGSLPK